MCKIKPLYELIPFFFFCQASAECDTSISCFLHPGFIWVQPVPVPAASRFPVQEQEEEGVFSGEEGVFSGGEGGGHARAKGPLWL